MGPDEFAALQPTDIGLLRKAWAQREARADFRAGTIASVLANINRDREKMPTPFQPADFFASLEPYRASHEPDTDEIVRKLDRLVAKSQARQARRAAASQSTGGG